ncbi:hypothetical protein BDZ91DRAFT_853173 [Kalaharituber pfeilii]|nr:hypothetical protein BDZ91DRAFT_853173 [Kalaharituber pfeilii]
MSQIRFQQRDRDLMPDADNVLTHEKLDSLWEWLSAANKEGLPPYLIFAKLVNAARNPYRDQLLIARGGHELLTPGTSAYAPSEFTATPGLADAQQRLEYREDKATIQALSAKVDFLEGAMNTQQSMINDLKDSLHLKQTMVQQLQDSLDAKHKTINQPVERIDNLNLKQEELQTKAETEKKELENDLQVIRLKSETPKQIQVALKSPHYGKFISITEGATGIATCDGREALILIKHPDGTFSFRNNGNPIAYLSNSDKYSFRSNHICSDTEKFRLYYADHGKTYIESVTFPGSFLSPESLYPNELNWCCATGVYSAFYIILT